MNERPTPETDELLEYLRVQFPATEGHIPLREKISKPVRSNSHKRRIRAVGEWEVKL